MMNKEVNEMYTFDADIVSDLYKDAYGFRPRDWFWSQWDSVDDAGKQRIWDALVETLGEELKREREQQEASKVACEKQISLIQSTVAGSTRDDAIRYMHDTYNTQGDVGFLEYHLGVPYGYLKVAS